jgi:Tfp pilus assembly protein PilO
MKKGVITTIVLFFIFASILIFADLPAYNKFIFARNEIQRYEDSISIKEDIVANVSQLKQIYENREDAIKKVSYVLPAEKDTPGLIVQFESLASENGLILERIDFGKVIKKTTDKSGLGLTAKVLEANVKMKGSYSSFRSFLEALEYNIRIMDVQTINISSSRAEGALQIFGFNIKLKVYYQ